MTPAVAAATEAIKGGMTAAEAAATFGISAAVTAALYGIEHYVGAGRKTANTLNQGLGKDFYDNVLTPLAVVNQSDPAQAHALMEEAWPKFLNKFETFASQGKNQRKVVDQMYATPAWLSTVTSIMGRNPFTSQPPAPKQEQQTTEAPPEDRVQLPDVNANAPDATDPSIPPEQGTPKDTLIPLQDMAGSTPAPPRQDLAGGTPITQLQDLQGGSAVTNQQNYVNTNTGGTHLQDYAGLIPLASMFGKLFAGSKPKTTSQKQDQAGTASDASNNIYIRNSATGGNASNVNDNSAAPPAEDPFGLNRVFTMPKPVTPPAAGHTMDSMVSQLFNLAKGGA